MDQWKLTADAAASLKADVDDATLVLRLGLVVTAIRSVQHFYLHAKDLPGPAGHRDRLWAFLLANAYLHEARITLQPKFPRVKELALKGNATEEQTREVGAFMAGNSDLGRTVGRLRNELVFHFDDDAIRAWVTRRVLLKGTRYHVYCVSSANEIRVLAVWHARRGAGPPLRAS